MWGKREHDVTVVESGAGPAVLLLDGFAEPADGWAAQVDALSREHRVLRCEPRGASLAERADAALAALDAAGEERAHVVGSSFGAAVAQQLAIAHPARVRTLALSGAWARSDRALRAVFATWLWTLERASAIEDVLHVVYRWTHAAADWNSGAADDEIARAASGRAGDWRALRRDAEALVRSALAHDVPAALADVPVPALVLVGAEDPLTPERYGRELAAALPAGRLHVVPGAGHRLFHDQPATANDLLLRFLASVPAPAAVAG